MSDKNLEQRKNIKFCVKIGKSASEMLAPLTVAYGEYAVEEIECFKMAQVVQGRVRRCARRPKKWAVKNTKDRCKSTVLFGSADKVTGICWEENTRILA